jgi:predicted dehydrogenase
MAPLRIGTLGAARITPAALIRPARQVPDVEVAAVAARDPARARKFADKHGIPRVHDSYEALLADPEIDAVYNPLPNGLHGEWTVKALEAGKHVLCEKPFTANAVEGAEVAAAADASGLVVMEAFHYRYHPLAQRVLDIVASGVLGQIRHVEATMCFPLPLPRDIRYRLDLAGGATMDAGCYAIHQVRLLAGAEPSVVTAKARLSSPGVDRAMTADLRFADGRTGRITCSLFSSKLLKTAVRVVGEAGRLDVINMQAPQIWNRVTIRTGGVRTHERVRGEATYNYQLRAFSAAVTDGSAIPTSPTDAVANMQVIDDVYRAAGLEPRQPFAG